MADKIVVLVACGSRREARSIARSLVRIRIAACVQEITAPIRSTYRWQGKIESAEEYLLLIKTTRKHFRAVQDTIKQLHGYEVPEIIALPVVQGARDYLSWITKSVSES